MYIWCIYMYRRVYIGVNMAIQVYKGYMMGSPSPGDDRESDRVPVAPEVASTGRRGKHAEPEGGDQGDIRAVPEGNGGKRRGGGERERDNTVSTPLELLYRCAAGAN